MSETSQGMKKLFIEILRLFNLYIHFSQRNRNVNIRESVSIILYFTKRKHHQKYDKWQVTPSLSMGDHDRVWCELGSTREFTLHGRAEEGGGGQPPPSSSQWLAHGNSKWVSLGLPIYIYIYIKRNIYIERINKYWLYVKISQLKKNLETESSFPKHYADRKINKESAARCSQPCRRPSFKPLRFPCPGPASAHPPHPPNGPSRSASGSSRPARLQLSLLSSPARALLALHPPRPHSTVTPLSS